MRRQLPGDLIAETYPCVDIGETSSCSALWVALAVEVHLQLGLGNEALGKQKIISQRPLMSFCIMLGAAVTTMADSAKHYLRRG